MRTKIKGEHRSGVESSDPLLAARNEVSTENGAFAFREGVGGGFFWACLCVEVAENPPQSGRH